MSPLPSVPLNRAQLLDRLKAEPLHVLVRAILSTGGKTRDFCASLLRNLLMRGLATLTTDQLKEIVEELRS